ncbi:MAG: haloalkane dehalogenase [Pseudomonadota bacterium]|jgi:haloalkane dehalogenase
MTVTTLPRPAAHRTPVLDSMMAYTSAGTEGSTIVFLHGNPTSSYIWRNIIPHVAMQARCIAPDLIGYGGSGKPDIDYSFADQARYLDAFLATLGLTNIILVAQDWGTALAFHYAARHPDRVAGLAFMEFIRPFARWDQFHQRPEARALFQAFRTPGKGEQLVLHDNVFIERVLPNSVLRKLSDEEMSAYRAPFPTPKSRKPILKLPNELPIEGQPVVVHDALTAAHAALAASRYPKVLFSVTPGALVSPADAQEFAAKLHDCELIELGAGAHYLQEDHADAIGRSIADWVARRFRSRAQAA